MREVGQPPELQVSENVAEDEVEAALPLALPVVRVLTRLLREYSYTVHIQHASSIRERRTALCRGMPEFSH